MKQPTLTTLIKVTAVLLIGLAGTPAAAQSGRIANWKIFDNPYNPEVPIPTGFGLNLENPTFGDGSDGSAQNGIIAGLFGDHEAPETVNLDIGQTLTVSASVILTGGRTHSSQYRFGIYNDGGKFALDDGTLWPGGFTHIEQDMLREASPIRHFISAAGAPIIAGPIYDGDPVPFPRSIDGDSVAPYHWTMSLTRTSDTSLDIYSRLTGGDDNVGVTFRADDYTTTLFTYTSMGLLFGDLSSLDQGQVLDARFEVTTLGDLNGDGSLTNADIAPFVRALTDRPGYEENNPWLNADVLGDFDNDGLLTNADIAGFVAALTAPDAATAQAALATATVPEPSSLALLGLLAASLLRRRGLLPARRRRGS